MSTNNMNKQGEYEALIDDGQHANANNAGMNTEEYYNIYGNNINSANINNVDSTNEHVPLGTPLTYIVGNEGEYIGNMHCENSQEKKRLLTDLKYCSFFIGYIIILLFIILYYLYYGEYARILYGTNYNGQICGKHLKKYAYLYYPLSPKSSKPDILNRYAKCVESCPTSNEYNNNKKLKNSLTKGGEKNEKNENNMTSTTNKKNIQNIKSFFENSFSFFDKNKKNVIMDKKGNTTTNVVYSDYTKSSNSNVYVEYSLNSPYYDSTNIMNICYPKDKTLREKVIYTVFTNRYKVFVNLFSFHNSFFFVFLFVFISLFLCFIYLLLLYYISTTAFHFFLISFPCLMLFCPIYFIHKHLYLIFNPVKGSFFSYHYILSILLCLAIVAHGIISFFILYLYKNTYKYTSRLISITLNFIYNMSTMLYSPIVVSLLSFIWFLISARLYVYIMTAGSTYENRIYLELDSNGNSEIVSLQKIFFYFKSSYLFSIFWIYSFFFVCEILQSLNQFTISYLGTVWYFGDKNSSNYNISGDETMKTILNHHFGSLILSSFISLSTKHMRILFFWTNSTLSLPFFFDHSIQHLKEKFQFILKPISEMIDKYTMSAYCEMSMTSYPYLQACDISSKKLVNSTSPAASLHGITYILNIIIPCFTILVVTFFSFNIFNNFQRYNDLFSPNFIPNPFFAALTIGVLCGIITSYFITVIPTLADSILYCFICECYQKQMIDESPMRKIFTPILLREFILEIYEEYNTKP
ncbi:inner membrane complex suture component, putative [Plasmodium malariae]|uniref:Choline transporter-like protein n=1 Tax=Plasmodium malariae TaxID=5858 RepID=A0A1D3TCM2_PLAMA|nr:inner membrane complex suture component, putative [Plasmodium malariae]SCP02637.1 inner membrane complex suture component, putative [Plasmodium malariae]